MKYFLILLVCIAVTCNAQYQQRGRFGGRFPGGNNNGYSGFPSTGGQYYENNGYNPIGNNGYNNNGNNGYSIGCNGGTGGFDRNGNYMYCPTVPTYFPGSNGFGDFSDINRQYPVGNSYSG